MTSRRWNLPIAALIASLYAGTIVFGLHVRSLSLFGPEHSTRHCWQPPSRSSIPRGPAGDSIRRGAQLFDETPVYASRYTPALLSCGSCHAQGGIQPFASPMVGLSALFPMFNRRAGHSISLQDRIQECFVRSENGTPLPYDGAEMKALVDYIGWLSQPQPATVPYMGRGLLALSALTPDANRGAQVYAEQCAGCHGNRGQGVAPLFPPLWGPRSFNDGAGMNSISAMAAFVQHNMPQNRMGILSAQEAFDVSAYIHGQSRPAFNPAYKHF